MAKMVRLALIPVLVALAQSPTGRITGRMKDPTGAPVPAAVVRAVSVDTNVETSVVSTGEGVYEVLNLIPGRYRLKAGLKGFKSYERGPLEVRVGDTLVVDIALEVGDVTESVTVHDEAPLLEAGAASVGQVIDRRRILDLPLPNGNLTYLMLLAPGVNGFRGPTHNWGTTDQIENSLITSPGTRAFATDYTLDGVPISGSFGLERNVLDQILFVPPPEMVQEVRIQLAAFDASVGHSAGANVDIAMKTGTNQIHGSALFSHNSRPLIARGFFINATPGREWPYSRRNKYRGSLAGPVYVPGLFSGRNRTFFSYGFQVSDELRSRSTPQTVPSERQGQGDLSNLLALGPQYQIYDPATTAVTPAGLLSRQPLPGNVIPANRLNPVALNLLKFYPPPNTPGKGGQNNYAGPANDLLRSTIHIARIDHSLSPLQRLYSSLSRDAFETGGHGIFGNDATGDTIAYAGLSYALNYSATLRPNLILDLRYGLRRSHNWQRANNTGIDLKSLGFPASLADRLDPKLVALPRINIDGYASLGSGTGCAPCPGIQAVTNHFTSAGLTHVRGTHTLRAGMEFRVEQRSNFGYNNVSPVFNFTGTWTNGPLTTSAPVLGQGLAEFLLGIPSTGYLDTNSWNSHQHRFVAGFMQDDWKISRRLTVNLGLRYELETPLTERFNRVNRGFDFTTPNPVEAAARARYARSPIPQIPADDFRVRGGILFAGVNGEPRGVYDVDANNLMPRIGLAWLARPKTVVRAGYGIYFGLQGGVARIPLGFNQRTPTTASADSGLTFRATLSNPFPDGIIEPAGASGGLKTSLGQAPEFYVTGRRDGYTQRWSFSVQEELPGRFLIEAGYIGSKSIGVSFIDQYDSVPSKYLSTSPVRDQATINFLGQQVANPFFGLPEFQGTSLQGGMVARSQLLRPMPQFAGLSANAGAGFSWYHAGYVRMERRFARGYTVQATYTWSKLMEAVARLNEQDPGYEHAISPQDFPHHLAVSGIWDIPFRANRRWARQLAGGWCVEGIYLFQSGSPLTFGNVIFNGRPAGIPLPPSQRTVERWFNTDAGFERDPLKQLASNLRTFPSRLAGFRGPYWNNWDLALFKNFRAGERWTFQLRGEAQDAFNHPVFNAPNVAPSSPLFGRITSTPTDDQRRITLSGKLIW